MHPFRKYISSYSHLDNDEWQQIEKHLTRIEYQKGDMVLTNGKVCDKLYFLENGFLRFFLWKDGMSVTKFFTESPYCFTSQKSFTDSVPTEDNIETLHHSVIWEMSKSNAFDLLKFFSWSEFVRKLIQEVQFFTEQILEEIQNKTAEERYHKMIEGEDSILTKAPLKDIASYLGIAPQSLSRIRKKYFEEKRKLT